MSDDAGRQASAEDAAKDDPLRQTTLKRHVVELPADHAAMLNESVALLRSLLTDPPSSEQRPPRDTVTAREPEPSTGAGGASTPIPQAEVPAPLAVDILLSDDVRNVKVQLDELLCDLSLERSDAVRYVRLAKAKRFYERVFPESAHGKAGKDPKSGSPRSIAFVDYAAKRTGWARASIADWSSTGERLSQPAFEELRGTKLANRAGALRKLAELRPREQFLVARGFRVGLDRDAMRMLDAYHEEFKAQKARDVARSDEPPPPTFQDENSVALPISAEGIECTLHGHRLRVSVDGCQVRVRYLAHAARPHVLAAEGWIEAVEQAASGLQTLGFEVDVSPIEAVCFRLRFERVDAVRHVIKVRAWRDATFAVILVTRWETACHAGPPLFTAGADHNLQEVRCPVITVSRPSEAPGCPWSTGRADLALGVSAAIRRLVLRAPKHDASLVRGEAAPAVEHLHATLTDRQDPSEQERTSP